MTTARSVAAVDFGATSGRVIVGRVSADNLEATTVARFANSPVRTRDGLHWDILGLYGAALAGLREAFRTDPDIRSIGIDSWAVDYALLRQGRLLGEPFHYRDDRTRRGTGIVHSRASHDRLYERNGLQYLPFNTVYQLASEPRELLSFADRMLLVPDLLAFWLTGAERAEATNASTTGLVRSGTRAWDDHLIDLLGLPGRLFPPIIHPGERYGELGDGVAESIGAGPGVTVTAVGSHDTASAVVAVPMDRRTAAYISCGTWGLVGVEIDDPVLTDAARSAGFTNEAGVGGRTRFLRNVMGLWILSEAVRWWEHESGQSIDLVALLGEAATAAPRTVPVFDVDDGRFLAPGDMAARITAWCAEHGIAAPRTRAEFARSIIESLATAFAETAKRAGALGGVKVQEIHVVGGGALNELLCQRTADLSGLPVFAGPVEATALGNLLIQARSLGAITGDLEQMRGLVQRTHPPRAHRPGERSAPRRR